MILSVARCEPWSMPASWWSPQLATMAEAGPAAFLFQVTPAYPPTMVKLLWMSTAQPLAAYNMLEQGAGEINIEGAVRLARLVRPDLSSAPAVGAPLLTSLSPPI